MRPIEVSAEHIGRISSRPTFSSQESDGGLERYPTSLGQAWWQSWDGGPNDRECRKPPICEREQGSERPEFGDSLVLIGVKVHAPQKCHQDQDVTPDHGEDGF
jgi:hypothetical protein